MMVCHMRRKQKERIPAMMDLMVEDPQEDLE